MNNFNIYILGCGSALPTIQHNPSAQIVEIHNKLFLIDCGEGTQLQLRKSKLGFNKLERIFISHLHGDHCFGLIGLISTMALLGRTKDLIIHAIADLETILRPQLEYFCHDNPFRIIIEAFDSEKSVIIYEDRLVSVTTIPLNHRVPCAGFLFKEKEKEKHLLSEMIKFYDIPIKELSKIKKGADFTTEDGQIIPNERLTKPPTPPRSYAYCSDTAYDETIIPIIEGVNLLYHESTFSSADTARAKMTGHSTSLQAAQIAKAAKVKKLILGHFSSRYKNNDILLEEAKSIFQEAILANENLCEKL